MFLRRTDMPVYPTPRIEGFSAFKMAVTMLGGVVMLGAVVMVMIMVMSVAFVALHVDAAVKVAIGLVHHRQANRSLGVGERDRERAAALNDLRQTVCGDGYDCDSDRCGGNGAPGSHDGNTVHSLFLFSASAANPSNDAT